MDNKNVTDLPDEHYELMVKLAQDLHNFLNDYQPSLSLDTAINCCLKVLSDLIAQGLLLATVSKEEKKKIIENFQYLLKYNVESTKKESHDS